MAADAAVRAAVEVRTKAGKEHKRHKRHKKELLFLCLLCLLCSFPLVQRLTLLANPTLSRPRITYQPISTCHQWRLKQAEAGLE